MKFPESESNILEFKRQLPKKDQVIKTAIAFCNTHGGRIVIGVTDDREIIGLNEYEIDELMEKIDTAIFDATAPQIIPRLYVQRFGDKAVLVIEIFEGMSKPYYLRNHGLDQGTYIRLGRHTVKAKSDALEELRWQSRGIDFERRPVLDATLDDLDEKTMVQFFKKRGLAPGSEKNEQILRAYHIIAFDQSRVYPSVLGMLIFGRQPQQYLTEATIICSHFKGNSGREAIASVDCDGNILEQFQHAFSFITSQLNYTFSFEQQDSTDPLKRQDELEIPEIAIREALLNMIAHRNYHIKAPSKIAIYEDRVEFYSPGQFPGPISQDNLQSGITYLRNPAICKLLREMGYIEKLGTGIITIFESCRKKGLDDPQIIEGQDYVKCILRRTHANMAIPKTKNDEILLLLEQYKEISIGDVVTQLSLSKSTATRRINELINTGIILKTGAGRATRYQLAKKGKA